jgi:hypothetical protein
MPRSSSPSSRRQPLRLVVASSGVRPPLRGPPRRPGRQSSRRLRGLRGRSRRRPAPQPSQRPGHQSLRRLRHLRRRRRCHPVRASRVSRCEGEERGKEGRRWKENERTHVLNQEAETRTVILVVVVVIIIVIVVVCLIRLLYAGRLRGGAGSGGFGGGGGGGRRRVGRGGCRLLGDGGGGRFARFRHAQILPTARPR